MDTYSIYFNQDLITRRFTASFSDAYEKSIFADVIILLSIILELSELDVTQVQVDAPDSNPKQAVDPLLEKRNLPVVGERTHEKAIFISPL